MNTCDKSKKSSLSLLAFGQAPLEEVLWKRINGI
jgi:hypothetical protein